MLYAVSNRTIGRCSAIKRNMSVYRMVMQTRSWYRTCVMRWPMQRNSHRISILSMLLKEKRCYDMVATRAMVASTVNIASMTRRLPHREHLWRGTKSYLAGHEKRTLGRTSCSVQLDILVWGDVQGRPGVPGNATGNAVTRVRTGSIQSPHGERPPKAT